MQPRALLRRAALKTLDARLLRCLLLCSWRSLSTCTSTAGFARSLYRARRTSSISICCHCSCVVFSLCQRSLFLFTAALSLSLSLSRFLCISAGSLVSAPPHVFRLSLSLTSQTNLSGPNAKQEWHKHFKKSMGGAGLQMSRIKAGSSI